MESTSSREIIENIIGETQYKKLHKKIITDILEKIAKDISSKETFYIVDIYCFILLVISNSESVKPVGTYKISLSEEIFEITTKEIIKEYAEYIKLIKNDG